MANNDFHDGIDVCVGNWGYYSEGELRDTWMHLPMDPDEIEPWLRGHGLVDEEHEETYISDYDGLPFRCPQVFNEYARLDKLNVLAMQLTLLPEGDLAHIQAAIDYGEPLSRLDELMNLVAQADETLAEWRGARGHDAAEKPAAPSEIAYAASAIAALSADDGTGGTERAAKL